MSTTCSRPLLAAKQQIPQAGAAAVGRERLLARIDGDGTRLTVVVAPAGWGKSTLLAQWARRPAPTRRVAWVSLDASDDEPGRFWAYLLSALGTVAPEVMAGPAQALAASDVDPVDVALPMLLNGLAATAERLALVLDDYHLIADPRIHEQLEFLLSYLPPELHLVLAGRADPPLPLARMRARGELSELRAADLRLRADEAAAMLASAGLAGLDADATRLLVTRAEGWAAGLRLAALTVRDAPDPRARALAVRGDDRHLFDFFAAEVLDPLPAEQRDLLVGCSVLDRLSGPLCDAVLGRTGCAGVLADLERAGVFVTAVDPHRTWFRAHPLFRDVLRRRLLAAAPDADRPLLARAADWFLADGEVEEAVRHRLAAGDQQQAAALLSTRAPWFMERGLAGVYFRLGGMLAPAVARADPRLCVQLAYAAATSGHDDRVRWWLDNAGPLGADGPSPRAGWRTVAGAAGAIRATVERAWTGGIEGALADAARAVELEDDPAERGYAVVRFAWGRVLLGAGRAAEAAEVLTAVRRLPTLAQTAPVVRMQVAGATALALLRTGRHDEARAVCAEAAAVAAALERSLGDAAGPALTLLRTAEGQLAHLDGDIPAARALLARAADLARVWGHESSLVAALTAQAQAELAGGRRAAGRALLNEAHDVAANGPVLPAAAEALRVAEARVGRAAVEQARHGRGLLIEELTDREQAILRALPGPPQREIGAELYISMNTVKGYTKSLYRKLGVTGRAEAVQRAREVGLI